MSMLRLVYAFFSFLFFVVGVALAGLLATEVSSLNLLWLFILFSLFACMLLLSLHSLKTYVEYGSYEGIPTHNPRRYRRNPLEQIDPPTREELNKLKEALGLDAGSLQYKKRGQGVYHVCYEQGKHVWTHIGSWHELKKSLEG